MKYEITLTFESKKIITEDEIRDVTATISYLLMDELKKNTGATIPEVGTLMVGTPDRKKAAKKKATKKPAAKKKKR